MFTALGSPKGALLGLSAAALIIAVSYSIAAPQSGPVIETIRSAPPQPLTRPMMSSTKAAPDAMENIVSDSAPLQFAAIDMTPTGAIGAIEASIGTSAAPQAMPEPIAASSGFLSALELLGERRFAEAYDAARSLSSPVERRTIQWAAIQYGNGAIDASTIQRFEADAPGFVSPSTFKTRLEQALVKSDIDDAGIIGMLGGATPSTVAGRIALANAYVADGQTARAGALVRKLWVEEFLDAATEKKILDGFGTLLTRDDHWNRAMHLMMHDRATGTERLFPFITAGQKSLAVARNAVSRKAKNAKQLLDSVDPAYKTNPVYFYSRAQRARLFELWDDAISWLDKGKPTDPDSAEWWYERQRLTRQLLALGDHKRAYAAAAGYLDGPEGRVVEARFHSGWIAFSFLKDADAAAGHFREMTRHSTLPDTISQSNYWLGRSLAQLGDTDGAKAAYEAAAEYPTVYYGLLARKELGLPSVSLRPMPDWRDSETSFESNEVVQAIRLLADTKENDKANTLLRTFMTSLQTGSEFVLGARLAQEIGAHHLAIAIADTAERRGMPLDLYGFPKDGLPTRVAAVDTAAIYAVARQESRFQVNAVSSAGARGLMQLMPGTAEDTARKLGLPYSQNRLTSDPLYNVQLGSRYLDDQLQRYDGSLLLAAAAYNAGPGNANKWISAFGDPRDPAVDPIVWVEMIPFQETRKYVQRVFGNYMVYRARLGQDDIDIAGALRSIRG